MIELCECGKIAVWIYMPRAEFYCDDCVSRGCDCQLDHEDDFCLRGVETLDDYNNFLKGLRDGTNPLVEKHAKDEQGRLLPCVEFMYDANGFECGSSGVDVLNKMFNICRSDYEEEL
jgi:hypothetical protein